MTWEVLEGHFYHILLTKQVLSPAQIQEGISPVSEKNVKECVPIFNVLCWVPEWSQWNIPNYLFPVYIFQINFSTPSRTLYSKINNKKPTTSPSLIFYFPCLCVFIDVVFSTQNAHPFSYYSVYTPLHLF